MALMEDTKKLTELRTKIDLIDLQLTKLLNERATLALKARLAKGNTTAYRPEREAQVLQNSIAANGGPLSNEALKTVFQAIIQVCRGIQDVHMRPADDN
jgi:chorismate mutase / prephenate dehydratase